MTNFGLLSEHGIGPDQLGDGARILGIEAKSLLKRGDCLGGFSNHQVSGSQIDGGSCGFAIEAAGGFKMGNGPMGRAESDQEQPYFAPGFGPAGMDAGGAFKIMACGV